MSAAEELRDAASLLRFDPTEFTTDATVGVALADHLDFVAAFASWRDHVGDGPTADIIDHALSVARTINGGAR